MQIFHRAHALCTLAVCVALVTTTYRADAAAKPGKKPLDHSSYERWNRISQTSISNDGQWVLYTTRPGKGTSVVRLLQIKTGKQYVLERTRSAKFSFDGKYLVYLSTPKPDPVKQAVAAVKKLLPKAASKTKTAQAKTTPAKKTTTKPATKYALEILELATGRKVTIEGVKSYAMPSKAADRVAYLLETTDRETIEKPGQSTIREVEQIGKPKRKKKKDQSADQRKRTRAKTAKTTSSKSGTLAVRNLATGIEARFPDVTSYLFSENGKRLAWTASASSSARCGVFVLNTDTLAHRQVAKGKRSYSRMAFDKSGMHIAFLVAASSSSKAEKSIMHAADKDKAASVVAVSGKNGFNKSRIIAPTSTCRFSSNGTRIFFSTVKRPGKTSKSKTASKVKVDIWHWKDPYLQPMQLVRAARERARSYSAVVHLSSGKTVQLADETLPSVTVGDEQNAEFGIGMTDLPYRIESSWDSPGYADVYLVDVKTGKRQRILKKAQARITISPEGKYMAWWDYGKQAWMAMEIKTRQITNLSRNISFPLYDETNDRPMPSAAYGSAGWLKGDSALLVYDKHDIWSLDPKGQTPPTCITDGFGRKHHLRFRRMRLDPDERAIALRGTLHLSAFHYKTKASGFYRDQVGVKQLPQKLVMKDEAMRLVAKARNSNDVLMTRSTFQRYPDLWQSTTDFQSLRRISDTNPQQKEYLWGKSELVEWKAKDGQELQGFLIKPEGFDPKKKYPMLVYFYERMSDRFHSYIAPAPVRASINLSFYASRGYLVFVPDITYKTGAPGESAVNAVIPGVEHLIKKGFVNEKAIGVQGHSWGGYQVAYLVTRTNIFAAAESGAPVSNMTSAYGGIRWSSGMSRMFQYERTQSRIGGTLWDAREKYLKNSPLFRANHIETPLLILHNDKDGAVPWYQGIELFVALRRLSKPAWMLNYNGEQHGLTKTENRKDFSIRMQQFFDHYLKGAPAPVWLSRGVPALEKGKVTGLDLEKPKSNAKRTVKSSVKTNKKPSVKKPAKGVKTGAGS